MPTKIRPAPGLALWHYPYVFHPKMAFQLRERDPATLEEMKNMVFDVEANLMSREANLKAVRRIRERKLLVSSEIKIDMLKKIVNEMMHMISRKEELDVQIPHVTLRPERKTSIYPSSFQSILDTVKHKMIVSCTLSTTQQKMKSKIRRRQGNTQQQCTW